MSELSARLREHYEQISPPLDTERLTEQFIGADGYRQRRRPAVAMAAAALLTILVIGTVGVMVLTGNGGPDVIETPQPNPPTTVLPPPESQNPNPEVFTFAENNLCEWVSANDVRSFVRSAYALSGVAWDGTAVAAVPEGSAWDLPGSDYCRWEPTGGGYVIARGLTLSQFRNRNPIEYSEIADRSGVLLDAVSGHPDIADGVIAAGAAFGRYGFWLEGSGDVLGLETGEVLGLEVVLRDGLTSPENGADGIDWLQQERMLFHVANSFLREMNWAPTIRDMDWMSEFERVSVSGQGPVFVSSALEVASFNEDDGWALIDVDALPEGAGLEDGWPGRVIAGIATGPEGELWVAGHAHSPLEDVQFGGSISDWTNSREFTWLARRDCERDGCTWRIFTPDEIPALNRLADIGALAVAADGTLYAVVGDNRLVVVSGNEGTTHTVPFLPVGWDGGVSPWARTLAVGTDGLVWAGTNHGRGLVTFDGTVFAHVTTDDGLPSNSTSRVAAAADGTIWVATDESDGTTGVASFDGSGWTSYPNGSADRAESLFWGVRAAVDADGVRWTVSAEGLTSFDGVTRQVHAIDRR